MRFFTITILMLLLLAAEVSFSQPRYSPKVRAERETKWMQDSLGLRASLVQDVKNINLLFNKSLDSTISTTPIAARSEQQHGLYRIRNTKMRKLLNSVQYRKYLKWAAAEEQAAEEKEKNNHGIHKAL